MGCTACGSAQPERMLISRRADWTPTLSAARPSSHSWPVLFVLPQESHTNLIIVATSTKLDAESRTREMDSTELSLFATTNPEQLSLRGAAVRFLPKKQFIVGTWSRVAHGTSSRSLADMVDGRSYIRSLIYTLLLLAPSDAVLTCECQPRRDGGTGRRSGLKIRRCLAPWGFNSPSRHQPQRRVERGSHAYLPLGNPEHDEQ